ncbi:hypothetical protein ACFL42_03390, partial [Candidatus Omnitrophota bacterium]
YYEKDFSTWNHSIKYDLICSFGFIEHFKGELEKQIIKKHIDMLKPGGKLILTVPNFNYGQYIICSLLNRRLLRKHNIKTMTLSYFKDIASLNGLNIIYLKYYGGLFDFWLGDDNLNIFQLILHKILRVARYLLHNIKLNNRFFSPYIVFIAEHTGSDNSL